MLRYYFNSVVYLLNRWILHKTYLTAFSPRFKFYFKFKTEDVIGRHIFKKGIYEECLTNFLLKKLKLKEEDIIFDIGANIGWYSVLLDQISPNSARIYAFEPDPLNFSLLKNNIKLNGAQKVSPFQQAVSDTKGTQTLYLYPSKNQGRHSLLPINSDKQVQVSTIMLDDFIHNNHLNVANLKFIKIDVEGYEYFALKGAKKALAQVPYILSEYSPNYMKKGAISPERLLDLLYSYSFTPHLIENGKTTPVSREDILSEERNINLFWIKEGHTLPA